MNEQESLEDISKRLSALEEKVTATYVAAEKTRKYILYTIIGAVVVTVLPLIGLALLIPTLLAAFSSITSLGF